MKRIKYGLIAAVVALSVLSLQGCVVNARPCYGYYCHGPYYYHPYYYNHPYYYGGGYYHGGYYY